MIHPDSSLPNSARPRLSTEQSSPHSPARPQPESSLQHRSPASVASSLQAAESPPAATACVALHVGQAKLAAGSAPNPQAPAPQDPQSLQPLLIPFVHLAKPASHRLNPYVLFASGLNPFSSALRVAFTPVASTAEPSAAPAPQTHSSPTAHGRLSRAHPPSRASGSQTPAPPSSPTGLAP
jgi:hypothetical protein